MYQTRMILHYIRLYKLPIDNGALLYLAVKSQLIPVTFMFGSMCHYNPSFLIMPYLCIPQAS